MSIPSMQIITSRTNPHVQTVARIRGVTGGISGFFVVEGWKLLHEVMNAGHNIDQLFILQGHESDLPHVSCPWMATVTLPVMEKISALSSPSPVLALCHTDHTLCANPSSSGPWVALTDVQDPGNTGMVLRSVAAFGGLPTILMGTTPSPLSEKVIRASAGASLKLSYRCLTDESTFLDDCEKYRRKLIILDAHGGTDFHHHRFTPDQVLVTGNEGRGVSPAILSAASGRIHIPMLPGVESLNAAVSTAIILCHYHRSSLSNGACP